MQLRKRNVYFLRPATARNDQSTKPSDGCEEALVVRLSQRAKMNLQRLQLKFLDRQGREPDASEVIEKLINQAVGSARDVPYPVR